MPEKTFEARLAAIETQMAGKTLETHFREHAELFDRMLVYRFEESDKKWDAKLAAGLGGLEQKIDTKLSKLEERLDARIDVKLETKLEPLRADIKRLTDAVLALVARLP